MNVLEKSALTLVACLLLSGCGQMGPSKDSGQSEAFKLGYSQAAELKSKKNNDKFFAYGYCTSLAQNIFATDSQQEFDEYVAGCMDYVMAE